MGRHDDSDLGRSDDWLVCGGEDRADPASWDDPAIRMAWRWAPLDDDIDVLEADGWATADPDDDGAAPPPSLARRAGGRYLNDLADAARSSGLRVIESPGWIGRNHGSMSGVRGVVLHHTGSSGAGAWTVVRDGRSDLTGPLAQLTLERDGTVRVLSNGQSWHAGTGSWPSIGQNNGNTWCIGIECVYNGSDITPEQRAAYPRLAAALVRHYGIPVANVIGHREWAPNRKVDPGQIDLPGFRRTTTAINTGGGAPAPAPAPAPARKGLPLMIERPLPAGSYTSRVNCPTGSASELVAVSWASVTIPGGGRIEMWAQKSTAGSDVAAGAAPKEKAERDWTLRNGERAWFELPSGTEFLTYRVTGAAGAGSLLIEQKPR